MKKFIATFICMVFGFVLMAQSKLYIHKSDHISLGAYIELTDSIYFNDDETKILFQIGDSLAEYNVSDIDSISFGNNSSTITVNYQGTTAYVVNPLAFEGVSVSLDQADVTVTTTADIKDLTYELSGSSTEGSFKIDSDKRFNLSFNGLNLTNSDGPAINIQSGKKVTVQLKGGTDNTISDGVTYANAPLKDDGEEEDQKAAFFSEGDLVFTGSGSLTINGKGTDKHALCSDEAIEVQDGYLTVASASKDGIHGKEGIIVSGGTVDVTATGDAIDGDGGIIEISGGEIITNNAADDVKGITCDSTLFVSGGTLNLTVSGKQSKALTSDQLMTLSGGSITVKTTGGVALESLGSGYDPSYCKAIDCNEDIVISGAQISITSGGVAPKGISSDTQVTITDGTITVISTGSGSTYTNSTGTKDSYHGTCLGSNDGITITGGTVTLTNSGAGGKGISCDGDLIIGSEDGNPVVKVSTSGSKITISSSTSGGRPGQPSQTTGEYDESKAITCNGSVTINNGTTTISSADDGIKSEESVVISNATVNITKSIEGIESPAITVNSGNVSIVASDDGFNATKGNGGESNDGSMLTFNGGYIVVNASGGDGLDSNGNMTMTGGTVIVNGPQSSPEVGIDFNGTFNISGGFLAVSGTNSNMTQAPSTSSSQYSVKVTTYSSLSSSTLFHMEDADGNNLVTFKPVRSYYSVIFSSDDLTYGSSYKIYTGGSSTGTQEDGIYIGGTYSGGTLRKTFTLSSKVTSVSF